MECNITVTMSQTYSVVSQTFLGIIAHHTWLACFLQIDFVCVFSGTKRRMCVVSPGTT